MTMLAKTTEAGALTLADYEARIHLYKEQIGTGYIGIGRTLLEAKEAKVVPHGQWENWMTETTGLTVRQAQRCMQAATEIRDGSALARLEMSKALLLLGSGLDEDTREEIAEKAADEGATVKDLREQLKQAKLKLVQETGAAAEIRDALHTSEEERQSLVQQIRAREAAYQERISEAREDAYRRGEMAGGADAAAEIRQLKDQLEKKEADRHQAACDLTRKSEAYERQKRRIDELSEQLNQAREHGKLLAHSLQEARDTVPEDFSRDREMLLEAAANAEQRAANAEAELEALRAGGAGQPDPAWKVLKVAVTRFMTDCEMLPLDPAALIPEKARIMANIERLEKWTDMMRIAMAGAVPGEGAVE